MIFQALHFQRQAGLSLVSAGSDSAYASPRRGEARVEGSQDSPEAFAGNYMAYVQPNSDGQPRSQGLQPK